MKSSSIIHLILSLAGILFLASGAVLNSQEIEEKGKIIVDIEGLRNSLGGVGILLFNKRSGLPAIYECGRICANLISKKYNLPYEKPSVDPKKILENV